MGMAYEAIQSSRWGWKWSGKAIPLPFLKGVVGVALAGNEFIKGIEALEDGNYTDATVKFAGVASIGLAFCGPLGLGLSLAIDVGKLGYENRDRIREWMS